MSSSVPRRHRRRHALLGLVAAAVLGALVGGIFGTVVAVTSLSASRRQEVAVLWRAAMWLVALAAVATMLTGGGARVGTDYAARRPLANDAALAALIVSGVAIAVASGRESRR